MKTITRLGIAGLMFVAAIGTTFGQDVVTYQDGGPVNLLQQSTATSSTLRTATKTSRPITLSQAPTRYESVATMAAGTAVLSESAIKAADSSKSKKAVKATASDLNGQWIMTYKGAASGSPSGGNAITIRKSENNDSVYLEGFWSSSVTLIGFYHEDAGNITIPYQKIATSTYYGSLNIGVVNPSTGGRISTQDVTIESNGDGTLSISGIWGIFITSGDDAGSIVDAFYNTTYEKGNSTMSHTTSGVTDTYPIIATQSSPNTVTVKNFRNLGRSVDIYLNRDKSATIKSQIGYQTTATANYYTVGNVVLDESGVPTSWEDNIEIPASTNTRQFKFTNWSMIYGSKYWVGFISEATVNLPFDVVYPEPYASTEFEGEGTAAKPYLIKSYDDLEILGNKVSGSTDLNATDSEGNSYARVFKNTYFRVENDIDLENRRFTPIGDATHHFAGVFDGNNHTIKNLYITTEDRYCAFFAQLDTLSTVKNLNFDTAYLYSTTLLPSVLTTETYGVIDNVHVNNAYVQTPSQAGTGLAGIAYIVKNCSVTNSTIISGQGFCGAISAQIVGSMTNSYASNVDIIIAITATSTPPVGGLVGASNSCPIDNCYFNGEIYGLNSSYPARIGGITGAAGGGATISRCFVNATLLPLNYTYSYTGGIAGQFYGTMTNCYTTGSITASQSALTGGLAGLVQYKANDDGTNTVSKFVNCYSAAYLEALTTDYDADNEVRELAGSFYTSVPPTFTNSYFDKQVVNFGSKHGATTAELTAASGPAGFSSSVWTFTEGSYPRLTVSANTGVAQMAATALVMPETSTYTMCVKEPTYTTLGNTKVGFLVNGQFTSAGKYATAENGKIKFNTNSAFGTDSLAIMGDGMAFTHKLTILPIPFEGYGTEASPYLIQNKADLITLSKMTTESELSYADMYFKMTADIDLEYDKAFRGLAASAKASNVFRSVFDGDGHTIHRMRFNNIVWKVKPEDDPEGRGTVNTDSTSLATYNAFIGRLSATGVLRNLTIASDCEFNVYASSAAFVGASNGLVENCYNYADVNGFSSWIGGIIAQTNQGAIVRNCYNAGNIKSGYRNAGGIVGSHHGIMENCVNVGSVEVTPGYQPLGKGNLKYAGGITGGEINGTIRNCLNAGSVYASEGNAGGISGSTPKNLSSTTAGSGTNDIISCISYGMVGSGNILTTGGIAGESGSVGTITGNVWDAQILPIGAFANSDQAGCTGVNTSALTSAAGISGFDSEYWVFRDGAYPVLKTFANDENLNALSKIVVKFADDNNALDLTKNATLADGITWSLTQGTVYSISGSTLNVPAEFTTVVLDTLVGVNGKLVKKIPLRSIPELNLDGKGTLSAPYLLKNATDWNYLADYMNKTNITFDDCFFKLTDDIDFTGTTLSPLGASPVNFNATLDGDNHAIKGYVLTGTTQYLAPINIVDEKGVIKNIKVQGKTVSSYTTNAKSYTGGLVARMYGAMENCELADTVAATKGYVGGLVGAAYSGASFTNCRNRGVVQGASYIAGLVAEGAAGVTYTDCYNAGVVENVGTTTTTSNYVGGLVATSSESSFTNCYNAGEFKNITNSGYVGGILAYAYGAKDEKYYTFSKCYNVSSIDARSEIGGIIGYSTTTVGAAVMQIDGCYNTGDLHTTATSNYMGGIIARYKPGSTISNCWNSGSITSDKGSFIGGIVGSTNGAPTSDFPVNIINCVNYGVITSTNTCAGGIVGNLNTYCSVQQCENIGLVKGAYGVGGIVAALYGATGEVVECINRGTIEATMNRAGGIVGYNGASGGMSSVISGCVNLGDVSTSCTTTGTATTTSNPSGFAIGGIAGLSPATIENCANYGKVKGASCVGGILGRPVKAKTKISGCYNVGELDCAVAEGGNIIGGVDLTDVTLWTTGNEITNSYYLTEGTTYHNDTIVGKGVTRAELAKLNIGSAWIAGDDYTYPVGAGFDENDAVRLFAAQVIPADGETLNTITKDFYVGNPSGITWTASESDIVEFSGNNAHLANSYTGKLGLTATLGDYKRTEFVTIDYTSGIENLYTDKDVIAEEFYDLNGARVAKPISADGRIYIVRLTYSDGTSKTVKLLNN